MMRFVAACIAVLLALPVHAEIEYVLFPYDSIEETPDNLCGEPNPLYQYIATARGYGVVNDYKRVTHVAKAYNVGEQVILSEWGGRLTPDQLARVQLNIDNGLAMLNWLVVVYRYYPDNPAETRCVEIGQFTALTRIFSANPFIGRVNGDYLYGYATNLNNGLPVTWHIDPVVGRTFAIPIEFGCPDRDADKLGVQYQQYDDGKAKAKVFARRAELEDCRE